MAWTAPMTFVPDSVLTAAQLNTQLRDNMLETAPAKATTSGGYFVATGLNAIVERVWASQTILTGESTSSATFVDIATAGPTVTVTTGSRALVLLSCNMLNSGSNICLMGVDITGATTLSPSDADSMIYEPNTANLEIQGGYVNVYNSLTPGVNTFTAKYKAGAGTATFTRRRLVVLPY